MVNGVKFVTILVHQDPLCLELSVEYWCQLDGVGGAAPGQGFTMTYQYRPPHRQLSLHKFVRHAGKTLFTLLDSSWLHSMLPGLKEICSALVRRPFQ